MKKFILTMVIMFTMMFSANAQIATENSKFFDNTFVSANAGVAAPLDFNSTFPLNTTVSVEVGKWFSPVWGAEIEGTAWFGSNGFKNNRSGHNFVRGHYVGANGLVNLTNLFAGYRGTPRLFEVSTMLGTGWIHQYTPNASDKSSNGLGVKTGLDLAFNLGKAKAHTVSIRPSVLWNVTDGNAMPLEFNADKAQLYLGVAYTYHFKTSNGTRHFKTYDIGAMTNEIARLNDELAKKPKAIVREVVKTVEVPAAGFEVKETVFFAFDSDKLDDNAKATLDKLGQNGVYVVRGYASNEGSAEYNKALSLRRAEAVAEYLRNRGAKIDTVEGLGVLFGPTTGRVAIVTLK
jgi:outer membrane protein OmpA-like peptidoglycan-associated protein